ncbi:MAG: cell division protein ZapE [Paracoccaceae bacterium]|nr:cell division protein ZapE [Paracoccaceae bacterium]MDG1739618.1 cell division protein ZapE [Paracoccaceae bacterium]MDG2258130.1 cell division protein ZapE [Paracoccaceae bacterium]
MQSLLEIYHARCAAGDLTLDPAQEAALPQLENIRVALSEPVKKGWFKKAPPPPKGLYIWGGVGRGKSMLTDLFVEYCPAPALRVHFHAFMQEIHEAMHKARADGIEDTLKPVAADVARRLKVLAFDEMQITDITDAMIVGRLFELLFEAGVVVITTSNRAPDDLYKNGLNRQLFLPFIELLNQKLVVWELTSPKDYRQDRLSGNPTYFTPINAESRAAIDGVWKDFTGGQASPLILKVKGRDVLVPQFRNGVARASFFDLCGKLLGAADYLALADAVNVLVLENIPNLSRNNFNEAKRFVTLIDALYEAKVRLICSAASKPETLYVEGEGVFEFERTASRLREMQADDWGA